MQTHKCQFTHVRSSSSPMYTQVSLGAVARAHSLALTRWADLIDTLDKGRTATPEFYAQLARFELELIYENVKYGRCFVIVAFLSAIEEKLASQRVLSPWQSRPIEFCNLSLSLATDLHHLPRLPRPGTASASLTRARTSSTSRTARRGSASSRRTRSPTAAC